MGVREAWLQLTNVASRPAIEGAELRQWQEDLGSALAQIPELDPKIWSRLPVKARLDVLQRIEQRLAAGRGRNPAQVSAREMGLTLGTYYWRAGRERIYVSSRLLRVSNPARVLNTFLHEDRHAFQANEVMKSERCATVQSWKDNWGHYTRGTSLKPLFAELGFGIGCVITARLMPMAVPFFATGMVVSFLALPIQGLRYRFQPIERDAFQHGNRVSRLASPNTSGVRHVSGVNSHVVASGTNRPGTAGGAKAVA